MRPLLLGVLPEHRRKGVDVMMILRSYKGNKKSVGKQQMNRT